MDRRHSGSIVQNADQDRIEIMSPANAWAEMHMKAGLYFEAGAMEVWVVRWTASARSSNPRTT